MDHLMELASVLQMIKDPSTDFESSLVLFPFAPHHCLTLLANHFRAAIALVTPVTRLLARHPAVVRPWPALVRLEEAALVRLPVALPAAGAAVAAAVVAVVVGPGEAGRVVVAAAAALLPPGRAQVLYPLHNFPKGISSKRWIAISLRVAYWI